MRDQRNAGGPETRVIGGARDLRAKFRCEFAVHGRAVHADFLEKPPAHHAHHAAAAGLTGVIGAVPRRADEASGVARIERGRRLVLEPFERRADFIAQLFEPRPRPRLLLVNRHCRGIPLSPDAVCLNASPNAMAAAMATLSERKPGAIGITSRASAAAATSSGTPADSRPNSRMSEAV